MLAHEPQVTVLEVASCTCTGAPQCGQLNWRPFSSLADSPFRPGELQVVQQHGAAALDVGRCVAVVDADHFAVGAAQLDHVERLAQRRQLGQLALGRDQLGLARVGHAVGLAVDGRGGADAKARGLGHLAAGVDGRVKT
jgi:hypothetical protein